MIRKSDVQWWTLEAKKHPESAPGIIEELAKRLIELDAENERLRNEIIHLQQRTPPEVKDTQLESLRRKVEALQDLVKSQTPSEPCVVFLSDQLKATRIPLSRAQETIRKSRPVLDGRAMLELRCMLLAQPGDELLLLTSLGHGLKLLAAEVPPVGEQKSWPNGESVELAAGERLAAAAAVGKPPRFWTVATRRGYVQRFVRVSFNQGIARKSQLVKSPLRNDEPVTLVNGDRGDLLLITRFGQGVRFSQLTIEAQGSVALDLEPDDQIVAGLTVPTDTDITIVTASGYAVRYDTASLKPRARPGGKGKPLIRAHDVLCAFPYVPQMQLLCLTYAGNLILIPVGELPYQQRVGKGTLLHDMRHSPAAAVVLLGAF